MIYYFDADAQVKYFINEPGSEWIRQIVDEVDADNRPVHTIATIEISQIEVAAALSILQRIGRIGKRLRDQSLGNYLNFVVTRCQLLAVDTALVTEATILPTKYPLKALDTLHLVAALRLNRELTPYKESLTLVSSDHQILNAAQVEGLAADNPHDH